MRQISGVLIGTMKQQMRRMRDEHAVQHIQPSLSEFLRESEAHVSYLRNGSHDAKNGEEGYKHLSSQSREGSLSPSEKLVR